MGAGVVAYLPECCPMPALASANRPNTRPNTGPTPAQHRPNTGPIGPIVPRRRTAPPPCGLAQSPGPPATRLARVLAGIQKPAAKQQLCCFVTAAPQTVFHRNNPHTKRLG